MTGRKLGTAGSRRIGRIVLQRYREEDFAPASDPAMSIRVCAVVMDELGSPFGNAGSEAGDPFQVVVVPVAGRHLLFPVIGDGPLGKVTHFRILVRIGVEAAGRGGSPDHVKPHSQRIRDVGNLLPGVRMETFVPPVIHPLDQFRRDHPLPEEQGKDVGLEQAPQDGGIEDGRGDETSRPLH